MTKQKVINFKSIHILNEMGEPSDKDIEQQEEFVSLDAWDSFRCTRCGRISNMFDCHSHNGDLICPKCGKIN